jgi:hypothetical protein
MDQVLGIDKGRLWIAEDFDAPLPEEILADFEGRNEDSSAHPQADRPSA